MEKYFNDAIIGNKGILASYTKKGELIRLFTPANDYRQFIDFNHVGIKVNDSNIIYLHDDINNTYKQQYVENTNILKTQIENSYFKVQIEQTDFADVKENILVRRYKLANKNNIDLDLNFLIHSKLLTNENNDVSGFLKENSLIQYMHDYSVCTFSKEKILSAQINGSKESIFSGVISGKDYIGMSSDSSISYDIGTLKPNEEKSIDIIIYINNNLQNFNMSDLENEIERLKRVDIDKLEQGTQKYWEKYVKSHIKEIKITSRVTGKIEQIYRRTILLYPLLVNYETGGLSAGVEVDEHKTKCGRYSYCWPRDAIHMTEAMDFMGMEQETEKFYKNFCKNTQSKNGMWEQRFYTDGRLAPCWGYQIDETASVVYGVYKHYERKQNVKFLKDNLKMCEKAVTLLKKYIDDVLEDGKKFYLSYDLWEENEGIHAYSLAAIFASFDILGKMYDAVAPEFEKNRIKLEQMRKEKLELEKYMLKTKEYVVSNFYDENKKSFIRSKDKKIDISLLGLVTPFKMFTPKEKKILNTVEKIDLTLRTYTGGYLRYEKDNYMGGNPWVISSLWLANYELEKGNKKLAKQHLEYVVKTATEHGFLGEQIDNKTLKPAWVIGLAWSHAMFVNLLEKLQTV